jgi:putative FmdB family regulatory protein
MVENGFAFSSQFPASESFDELGVDLPREFFDKLQHLGGNMPTYDYECQKCGHRFDLFQSIKDNPKRTCPKCRGRAKRLLGTGAGLLFKGSGFYATDYRKPGYAEAAKKESGSDSSTSSAGKETAQSKQATKSAKKE